MCVRSGGGAVGGVWCNFVECLCWMASSGCGRLRLSVESVSVARASLGIYFVVC